MDFHHLSHDFRLWQLNMQLSKHARAPFERVEDGITYRSGKASDLKDIDAVHQQLFRLPMLGWLRWVYRFRMPELATIARDSRGALVGYSLCMFNVSEVPEHLIHEIYIAITPDFQGKGLAVKLRRIAAQSYDHGRFAGMSTLAGVDDIKALRTAQRAGFAITKFSAKPPAHYLLYPLTKRQ